VRAGRWRVRAHARRTEQAQPSHFSRADGQQHCSIHILRERGELESDLAEAWWRLPSRTLLTLEDGRRCLLLSSGQPGGSVGPDVRDAVVRLLPRGGHITTQEDEAKATDEGDLAGSIQLVGDVEFHVRASEWYTHGHHSDPRYNRVVLHVVRYPAGDAPTRRQDGQLVPVCSLLDTPQAPRRANGWPCQQRPLGASEMTTTLLYAGLQRFAEKSEKLRQELLSTKTVSISQQPFSVYDTCLLVALAEGLGYGRDRVFFRAVGQHLVGNSVRGPEPASLPAPLDMRRLHALSAWLTRWQEDGAWNTLSRELYQTGRDVKATASALRAALHPLSRARADILIVNIVLPFAAAIAVLENDPRLAARAQQIFLAYPGLVSNRITRGMKTQLQLPTEPAQACLQQGLQHIYTHTCRAKACQDCLCGGQRL